MRSLQRGGDRNKVTFYGAIVAAVSGGQTGGWKAGQVTTTVKRWVIRSQGESLDSRDPV